MSYNAEDVYDLVQKLNRYRDAYYNDNESLISDKEYDILFDNLVEMERETGIVLSDSPTVTVGYKVVSDLEEVEHEFPPLLSLDKSKDLSDMLKFMSNHPGLVMAKMDGLTCRITYRDGKLYRAETRGDGYKGENVTHNICVVKNVPLTINQTDEVIVDGEVIVTRDTFAKLREKFVDNKGNKYKNPRNFASGSIRLHDSSRAAERGLMFVAWKFVKGSDYRHFSSRLNHLEKLGFVVTPYTELTSSMTIDNYKVAVEMLQERCDKLNYPIDGCVFSYNVCEYMDSLGYTSHHSKAQIAFKFYDDKYDTVIRDIDWTIGKTGALTPTAMFDTVEIDGTDVCRASLHNLTIMKQLNVRKNCTARVFKANMIIPQVDSVDDDGVADFIIPDTCPICGGRTDIRKDNDSEVLFCTNPECKGKLLGRLCTYVSKQGLDIEGLSEGKLQTLIDLGLVKCFADLYKLDDHYEELVNLPGWGVNSVEKLLNELEKYETTCEKYLTALSIEGVGSATAKELSRICNGNFELLRDMVDNNYDFTTIPGYGPALQKSIITFFKQHDFEELNYLKIVVPQQKVITTLNDKISGKTFCITGTFNESRSELQTKLESLGGVFVPSVTKKTEILFVGDKAGSKLKKAQELGIIIYDENQLKELLED